MQNYQDILSLNKRELRVKALRPNASTLLSHLCFNSMITKISLQIGLVSDRIESIENY